MLKDTLEKEFGRTFQTEGKGGTKALNVFGTQCLQGTMSSPCLELGSGRKDSWSPERSSRLLTKGFIGRPIVEAVVEKS